VSTFNRQEKQWFGGTARGEERGDWRNQNPSRKNGLPKNQHSRGNVSNG